MHNQNSEGIFASSRWFIIHFRHWDGAEPENWICSEKKNTEKGLPSGGKKKEEKKKEKKERKEKEKVKNSERKNIVQIADWR